MRTREVIPGLALALGGGASATVAALTDSSGAAAAAGLAALVGGVWSVRLVARLRDERTRSEGLVEDKTVTEARLIEAEHMVDRLSRLVSDAERRRREEPTRSAAETVGALDETASMASASHPSRWAESDGRAAGRPGDPGVPTGRDPAHPLTHRDSGLMAADYFRPALEDRLAAARRTLRPVTVVMLRVTDSEHVDSLIREREIGLALRHVLRECDTACRINEGDYALLLDDTPDTSAVWAIERLRRELASGGTGSVRAGIASYPIHGLDASRVVDQAAEALSHAAGRGSEGIQVARAD